jgi:hypothetical protein
LKGTLPFFVSPANNVTSKIALARLLASRVDASLRFRTFQHIVHRSQDVSETRTDGLVAAMALLSLEMIDKAVKFVETAALNVKVTAVSRLG